MRDVSVKVSGLECTIEAGQIESDLIAKTIVKERIWGGIGHGKWRDVVRDVPIFRRRVDRTITCGLGAILFLAKDNPFITFTFSRLEPRRKILQDIFIPPGITSSPKWTVNGRERYYFHEALQACRNHHCGTIKLPTGSGKTPIGLTLAFNQVREFGTGVVLVPTNTIKSQFIKSSSQFGIELIDYRKWLRDLDDNKPSILISLPMVLNNDITKYPDHPKFKLIQWIIADECHHAGCETWNSIFMGLPNLTRSHGFSALPVDFLAKSAVNFSGLSLEDAMIINSAGPVIYAKSTKELEQFLNIPSLINLSYTWPTNKFSNQKTDDWHKIRELQHKNQERIEYIASVIRLLINRNYNTIVHVSDKKLGKMVLEAVNNRKCIAWYGGGEVLGSNVSVEELRTLAGTEILGMICTQHAIEGLDLDSPLNAIVVIEGKKPRQILQKCGRIVRPGEKPSIIVNLMDRGGVWVLPRHGKERKDKILEEFDCPTYEVISISQFETVIDLIEDKYLDADGKWAKAL